MAPAVEFSVDVKCTTPNFLDTENMLIKSALKNSNSSRNRLNSLIKDQEKFDMDCKKS